jgi:hypothetical protein
MKKLVTIIILLISSVIYSQSEVTSEENVKDLLNQINRISFKKMEENEYFGFVGRTKEIEIYWMKKIGTNTITYEQIIFNLKFNMGANGHTIVTDLNGGNAYGYHEVRLNYKKL